MQKSIKDSIKKLEVLHPCRATLLYLKVYLAIFILFYLEVSLANPWFTLLSIILIAGRQHSLYVLNHDASHRSLFQSEPINKTVATIFSNLVKFHHPEAWSFVQWRRIHLKHHAHLFTDNDPNYMGRQRVGDTERAYTPIQLFKACVLSVPQTIRHFFIGREDYIQARSIKVHFAKLNHLATLVFRFQGDPEMENERRIKLLFFLLSLSSITYFKLWYPFLVLWILPMYLIYPMILRFHDLTEHRWEQKSADLNINTRSVKIGFLAKIIVSHLPRGLHREHHMFPRIPVVNLPKLSKLLCDYNETSLPIKGINRFFKKLLENSAEYAE